MRTDKELFKIVPEELEHKAIKFIRTIANNTRKPLYAGNSAKNTTTARNTNIIVGIVTCAFFKIVSSLF